MLPRAEQAERGKRGAAPAGVAAEGGGTTGRFVAPRPDYEPADASVMMGTAHGMPLSWKAVTPNHRALVVAMPYVASAGSRSPRAVPAPRAARRAVRVLRVLQYRRTSSFASDQDSSKSAAARPA